jgi:hypothetical protein
VQRPTLNQGVVDSGFNLTQMITINSKKSTAISNAKTPHSYLGVFDSAVNTSKPVTVVFSERPHRKDMVPKESF